MASPPVPLPFELEWQLRSSDDGHNDIALPLEETLAPQLPITPLATPRPLSRSLWPASPTTSTSSKSRSTPTWCTLAFYMGTPRMFYAALTGTAFFSFLLTFVVTYSVLAAAKRPSPTTPTPIMVPFWPPYEESHSSSPEWSYTYGSADGPEAWAGLVDSATQQKPFTACSGTSQSPVDLPPFRPFSSLPATNRVGQTMAYDSTTPTWQVTPRPGGHPGFQLMYDDAFTPSHAFGNVTIGGALYTLSQFHFHAPSEHTVNGHRYPMEVHFLHTRVDNPSSLAVFSILYNHSTVHNPALDAFWMEIFHAQTGLAPISLTALFAQTSRTSQSYTGSITTPPCKEGVLWYILESTVGVNPLQTLVYTYALNGIQNFRMTQALNGRTIDQAQFF